MTTQFPKACSCGLTHSEAAWAALPLVGTQDDGAGGLLVLRNCSCRSTLAVQVAAPAESGSTLSESSICVCDRCGHVEECRMWRGLHACVVCEYALEDWAAKQENYARSVVRQNAMFRALRTSEVA